jgi:hypothetical protein
VSRPGASRVSHHASKEVTEVSRYVYDGKTKIVVVPAIADVSAPTLVELNAVGAIDLSTYTAKDGLNTNPSQNMVDSASLADTFNAQVVGTWGIGLTLNLFRDDTDDEAWDSIVYDTDAFLVVRRGVPQATAWANGQDVEVYPIEMHEPVPQPSASDTQVRFTAALAVTGTPNLKAVVGGSGS